MALTEDTIISQISVDADGNVSVRKSNRILRDGVVISEQYHRHVLSPIDPLDDEDEDVVAIATVARKPERVAKAEARRQEQASFEPLVVGEPIVGDK